MKVNQTVIDQLHDIAGLLKDQDTAKPIIADKDGVIGVAIFLNRILTATIVPLLEAAISDDTLDLVTSQPEAENTKIFRTYFVALTNAFSYPECAMECLNTDGLLNTLMPMWFDVRNSKIFPFSLKALHNLSTDEEVRLLLIKVRPSVLHEACGAIKTARDNVESVEQFVLFLANMTASREARRLMLDPNDYEILEDIFKGLEPERSTEMRKNVSRIIKHLTADAVCHSYLLGDVVNILPSILLPLAGGEVFDDDEYAAMPAELQYLDADKTRESNPEVKENLLAALLQLCRLKVNRQKIRDWNTYLVLRELHKTETDDGMLTLVENVVDLLIRTEEEIGSKGDFVDFEVPPLEDWINRSWEYPATDESDILFQSGS